MTPRFASRPALTPLLLAAALGGVTAGAACDSDAPAPIDAGGNAPVKAAGPKAPADVPDASSSVVSAKPPASQPTGNPPPPPPDLYDPSTIPKFELTFDAPAMAILTSTNEADHKTWVHAAFKFGAITFADVGVKRKGTATYRALPNKAALKVKLNKWVKGQKLYGLEELTLNNMVSDPTFLAERLAYHVFRAVGLPAPRANTAQVAINGEDYGIYANVESPDENFVARVFGKKGQTLYEVNGASSWRASAETWFEIEIPFPNAPAGSMPDVDGLFAAVRAANDATLIADLAGHLHTTQWLRHSATEAAVGHYDGYAYGAFGSHNYFMAGDTDGKFSLVPWSTDLSLSDRAGVPDAANPLNNVVLARCKQGGTCWEAYKTELKSVLTVYETLDLVELAHEWHDQIDALAKADPKREVSLDYHASQTQRLYTWLAARPNVVRAQLGL